MTKDEIKLLRRNLKLTQTEFAKMLHISKYAVQSWEIGRSSPRGLYLDALLVVRQATLQGGFHR